MVNDAAPTPPSAPTPRPPRVRDWMGLSALGCSILGLLSCLPVLCAAGGVLGFISFRRARAAKQRSRLATAALVLTGLSLVLQVALWQMAGNWLLPAMQRRTVTALTAACQGDWGGAVPASQNELLVVPLPAPTESDTQAFSRSLIESIGPVRSISMLNPEIGGALVGPTVSMALVITCERGSATGSARVQWVPSDPDQAEPWMPSARVLELEVNLPDQRTLSLRPTTEPPATPPNP